MKPSRWEILAAAITILAFTVQLSVPLNWDVAWLTYLAREANSGIRVYREYVEINPPLQLWLLQPVVATADLLGVPVASMVKWVLFGIAVGLTWSIGWGVPQRLREQLLWGIALGALLLPMDQFAQRDHFSALLLLPCAGIAGLRRSGNDVIRRRAVVAGLLAGAAIALKPHYAVALPLLAVYSVWGKERSWRSLARQHEIWVPVMLVGVYLFSIALFTPEYFNQARAFGAYYLEWHQAQFYEWLQPLSFLTIAVVLAWGAVRRGHPHRIPGDALLITALGMYLAALIQDKGFSYHLLPAAIGASALLPLIVSTKRIAVASLVVSVALIAVYQGHRWARSAEARVEAVSRILQSTGARSVLVVTHMVRTAWPAVLLEDVRWGSSFPSTWWMASLVERRAGRVHSTPRMDPGDLSPVERQLLGRFADDLEKRQPDLVMAYSSDTRVEPYRVGIMEVLELEPRALKALSGYTRIPAESSSLCLYARRDLILRIPAAHERTDHSTSSCEEGYLAGAIQH